jgi:Polyketide cyclase / dehydrase and lipid transport
MTEQKPAAAQADVAIDADPQAVYALITDLPTLASLAEETAAMKWRKGDSAAPGAVFKGTNRNGIRRWSTTCTVTDAEPGSAFAFDVAYLGIPVSHWRYDIVPVAGDADGRCRVTEQMWDRRPGWFVKPGGLATGVMDRPTANTEHIKLTLQRLKKKAEGA